MRRFIHIVIAAVLAAFCVLPASGQDYKQNRVKPTNHKVKTEPIPLVLSKTIELTTSIDSNWSDVMYGWNNEALGVDRLYHSREFGKDYILYTGVCRGSVANKETFNLWMKLTLFFDDEFKLDLVASDISVFSRKDFGEKLSTEDNRNNRPWLWRVFHNSDTIDKERAAAIDYFNMVADSLEAFLKDDSPLDLQKVN